MKQGDFLLSDCLVLLVTAFCRSYLRSPIISNQGGLIFFCSPLKPWLSIQEKLGSIFRKDRQYMYIKCILALNLKQLRWDPAVKLETVSQADPSCVNVIEMSNLLCSVMQKLRNWCSWSLFQHFIWALGNALLCASAIRLSVNALK